MNKRLYKIILNILVIVTILTNISLNVSALINADKNINFKRITIEDGLS